MQYREYKEDDNVIDKTVDGHVCQDHHWNWDTLNGFTTYGLVHNNWAGTEKESK